MAYSTRRNSRPLARRLVTTLCLCLSLFASALALAQSGDIEYIYDEAGRLVGVVDPTGDTVVYAYDAVGNLLSVSRHSSSVVSIIEFTPDSGTIGETVTIYGSGFSTTASQNAVTFNGTSATVSSATATKLVTTVPSGATTGAIAVTSPGGSATSGSSFTVLSGYAAPTVTGFSPTIGVPGTSVSISGTNFETTLVNNRVKLNRTHTQLSAATTTSISTSVPGGTTSGRVTVSTPYGSATSADDFFVPISPNTASDVAVTGRMTGGETRSVTLSTSGKVAMLVFDASAGQHGVLKMNSSTIASARVTIYNPNGTSLTSNSFTTSSGFLDTSVITTPGTHTILIDPDSTYTGTMSVTLYLPTDVTGTITAGGSAVTTTTATPGQNSILSFSGTANQRVSLKISGVSLTGGNGTADVYLRKPDGSVITSSTFVGSSGAFIDTQVLPFTGTYTILFDPQAAGVGSGTLTLYTVPADVTGSITIGGSAVTVTTTTPGQNGVLSFSGTSGNRLGLKVSGVSLTGGSYVDVSIKAPNGSTVSSATFVTSSGAFIEPQAITTSGTYTVFVNPQAAGVGSSTVTLYDVPTDVTGTITPGGSAVTVTTTTPGQNVLLSFSGTANQRVSLKVSSVSLSGGSTNYANLYLKRPSGATFYSDVFDSNGMFMEVQTLPDTGTYTLLIDPTSTATGSATLTLYDVPADVTNSITPGGSAVTVTTTTPGQNGVLSFTATANQRVSLKVSGVSLTGNNTWVNVYLKRPNGTTQASDIFDSNGGFIDTQTLASAGTYTILVDPYKSNIGSVTITLYDVPADVTNSITPGGSAVTVTTTPGQNAVLSFTATAGQRVSLGVSGGTMAGTNSWVYVYLKKPDGSTQTWDIFDNSGGYIDTQTLVSAGTYTILVDPYKSNAGSVTITLNDVPADATGSVTVGGSATTITTTVPGQNGSVTFSGTSGQQVTVHLTGNTEGIVTVALKGTTGSQLTSNMSSGSSFNLSTQTLSATGTYTVTIDPYKANTGSISVSVTNP